ncbi:3' exoribonuclease family, domain 1 domain-containing protein [Ditylenchus destructor]|uniref:3' exoribonuclease family, domain 1 domain-containing protein n=1 Tax=Ditylenchus destructor TaxID=166010 RepID=A0AAD4R7W4_9BILA|nr:3' exoribonuclease family, domain 1 domain-containing protein [Ditylenchus destructor]
MSNVIATQRKVLTREADEQTDEPQKANDQFRKMLVRAKVLDGPVGSAYIEMGNTKVMCSVNGPKEQQSGDYSHEGSLNVSIYGIDSTNVRYTIQSSLNAVVCLKKLAKAKVDVELNVLADDGGLVAACLMVAGVALISASIECFDLVLACNLLLYDSGTQTILDPTQSQLKKHTKGVNVTIGIMPALGQVVCCDVNGLVRKNVLDKALDYGFRKCLEVYPLMSEVLRSKDGNLF